jgi:UV DNA damage endonuclease
MAIGYACITIGLPNTSFSRCILKNATNETMRNIIEMNLATLEAIVDYNIKHNIKLFRISSDIIPFGSHPINQMEWWIEYKDQFLHIGNKIKKSDMRVSMHPGQYTVLNSGDSRIVENAIHDLEYHSKFLETFGMDRKSKLVLHIGGVYGDKDKAIRTFVGNYKKLPQHLKDRIIIENDERNYNIQEVLSISNETGAPVVFDNLHHAINKPEVNLSEAEWILKCGKTWREVDGKQKVHYSQQKEGGKIGSHSDTIFIHPFLDFYKQIKEQDINIMLEVKDKNLSAIKCFHVVNHQVTTAKMLEEEWARYKYFVLSKSAKLYDHIRQLLKEKEKHVAMEFYEIIEKAYLLPEDKGAQVNAVQHVWGYISKDASNAEKNRYNKLLEAYIGGTGAIQLVKNHLLKCAQIRNSEYLINSLYFYIS